MPRVKSLLVRSDYTQWVTVIS